MLASFVVHLQPLEISFLSPNSGPLIHALFLSLVSQSDASLANSLHQDIPLKPFTVSALQGKFARTSRNLVTLADNIYWLRITTLEPSIFATVNKALLAALVSKHPLTISNHKFQITEVRLEATDGNPWGGISSFEKIYEQAADETDITLLFHSPTTFRQKGMNLPLPLPATVFNGYLHKWNAFSPRPIDPSFLSWIENNLAVEAHRIRTRMTPFEDFQLTGFIGICRYRAVSRDTAYLKALNALADFAFYCGTGAKTTMGMGQTRRLK